MMMFMETPSPTMRPMRVWPLAVLLVVLGVTSWYWSTPTTSKLLLEEKSKYSHIRVRAIGKVHTLIFVRDNGHEVVESRMDLNAPHKLLLPYSQSMFASHLYQPTPQRVLVVGLGAGSMVRFLHRHQPTVKIDAVEIDPAIVRLADEIFGTRSGKNVQIVTADAFDYLADTKHQYDCIYMDAFLKPAAGTDRSGVPQRLKTIEFYKSIQAKLSPEGLVVFNLNVHDDTDDDIETIDAAFAATSVFECATRNLIVVAQKVAKPMPESQLIKQAETLDKQFNASFSFLEILAARVQKR